MMTSQRLLCSTLLALLLLPALAHAQERTPALYFGVGPSVPLGDDLERVWSTGIGVGGGAAFPLSSSLRLRADLAYSWFPLDEGELLALAGVPIGADVEFEGGATTSFTTMGLIEISLPTSRASVRPYLLVGGGYWHRGLDELLVRGEAGLEAVVSGSDNGAVAAVGGGVEYPLSGTLALFFEGRHVWADFGDPPNSDDTYLPVMIGVTFHL